MRALLFALLLFFSAFPAFAGRYEPIAFDAAKLDPNRVTFSLVVAGASDREAFMVAGHLILRVRQDTADYAFDWGVFDPTKKDFFIDYMRGRLNYEHIVRPFYETIRIYQYERRQLTEYPLTLTTNQKQKIITELIAWAKPENRVYAYDIVLRNCSTVIGGLVVDAVGSKLAESVKKPSGLSFRTSGLPYLAHYPPIEVFTDMVGGPIGDRVLSERELFYLPILVPQVLLPFSAYDDSEQELPEKLLGTPRVLLAGDNFDPVHVSWTTRVGVFLFVLGAALLLLARKFQIGRLIWRWFAGGYIFLSGFFGCVITFLSFFAQHSFALGNIHVFFFWPIDLLFLVVLFRRRCRKFLSVYAGAHIVVAVLATVCTYTIPGRYQDIGPGWKLSVPVWLLFLVYSLLKKKVPAEV